MLTNCWQICREVVCFIRWNQGQYNYENWSCWQIAAIYPVKKATTATHACIKLHTEVMSWISGTYECRFCMALTSKANSTTVRNLYRLWAACPCLSWSAVAMRALCRLCSSFPSHRCCTLCGSSPSPIAGWGRDYRSSVREISKCAHLIFKVYGHK